MLRGTSFVFRSYQSRQENAAAETSEWGIVFGVASIIAHPAGARSASSRKATFASMRADRFRSTRTPRAGLAVAYCVTNGLLALDPLPGGRV